VYVVDYATLDLTSVNDTTDYEHLRSNATAQRTCTAWAYDDTIFSVTIVNRVRIYHHEKNNYPGSVMLIDFEVRESHDTPIPGRFWGK
jgi:hypothetical protein